MKKQSNVYFDGKYLNADHYVAMGRDKAIAAMQKDGVVAKGSEADAFNAMQKKRNEDMEAYKAKMDKEARQREAEKNQRTGMRQPAMPSTIPGEVEKEK